MMPVGFFLLTLGWVILFLMIIGFIPHFTALGVGAYATTFIGLLLGLVGMLTRRRNMPD